MEKMDFTGTMTKLDEIRARRAAAHPGRWRWEVSTKQKSITLENGRWVVMSFDRWGMGSAAPTFNCDGIMERADKLTKSIPGYEHHVGFDDFIDHPDAIFIASAAQDVTDLLSEIDRLTDELIRLKSREAARVNAHLHIDTEPKRRKTVASLPYIGISTVRGVLKEGGCIALALDGTEALITAQNVAVGRLRPGTRMELAEGEIPIRERYGSIIAYSLHPVANDPAYCKVGG